MKKFLGILLSVVMVLALVAGCGSSNEPAAPAAQPSTPAPTSTDNNTPAPAETTETMGTPDVDLNKFEPVGGAEEANGLEGAKIKIVVGTSVPITGAYNQGLIVMKKLLEGYSNGTMTLEIHGDSSLGGERDMIESVSLGSQDMLVTSTGPVGNFVPDFYSIDLPYFFQSAEEAYKALDSEEVGRYLMDQFYDQGIYAVNFFENGFRNTTNNKREIVHPEDLKGLKLRTMENNIHMATYNNWGVYATPMAMGEVFTAGQQGTIDGQENPHHLINSNKLQEVQPYVSMTQVFYSASPMMVNLDLYNSWTDFERACFDRAADEAHTWERNFCQATLATDRADIEKSAKVTDVDIAEWAASEGVAKVYADATSLGANQTVVDACNALLGR